MTNSGADSRGRRRVQQGVVVSDKMQNTVVVRVTRKLRHPQYGKVIARSKNYYAHDASGKARVGDAVTIVETRPISKTKRWRVVEETQSGS